MTSIIQNVINFLSPFNQLLLVQKLFSYSIIQGIKTVIPDYTNDDTGMYKIINYYGKNKDNLSKIYFFLSLFAKQLNYGEYDEKTQKIMENIKKRFFNLIDDIYIKNIKKEEPLILNPKTSKTSKQKNKKIKSKISKKIKSKISKKIKSKSIISKIKK